MRWFGWFVMVGLVFACSDDDYNPAAPEEAAVPVAAVAACPCWDEATLSLAFPAAQLFLEAGGTAALTRFDYANAQQLQAILLRTADGGSCELASFGTAGLVEALASAAALSVEECAACAAHLKGSAVALGLSVLPPDGEGS